MKNKDKRPKNENGDDHGYWETYYENGQIFYKGNYVSGMRVGYWVIYYNIGGSSNTKYYYIR